MLIGCIAFSSCSTVNYINTAALNESEVGKNFEVVAFGSYTPIIIPLLRPERPMVEKYLLWKAARKARKLGANGAIIDNKNDFRVIKVK